MIFLFLYFFFFGLVIGSLILFSYLDLKYNEVSNELCFSFFIISSIFILLGSSVSNNFEFLIVNSMLGFVLFTGIGLALFYLKAWGGADTKILASFGLLIGLMDSYKFLFIFCFLTILYFYSRNKSFVRIKDSVPLIPVFLFSYIVFLVLV